MSGSIRLFHPAPLAAGASTALDAAQLHYLATVMRRRPGETVRLFNPTDGEFEARILTLRPARANAEAAHLAIGSRLRAPVAEAALWLLFALLKRDATDLVIRQASELGVTDVQPVLSARTNSAHLTLKRALAIAIEAAEQSERLAPPAIHPAQPLPALLAGWAGPPIFAAVERAGAPPPPGFTGPAALLVGPEGGFTPVELDLLAAHPLVTAIGLGRTTLRAETAAVAGLALLQAARRD